MKTVHKKNKSFRVVKDGAVARLLSDPDEFSSIKKKATGQEEPTQDSQTPPVENGEPSNG